MQYFAIPPVTHGSSSQHLLSYPRSPSACAVLVSLPVAVIKYIRQKQFKDKGFILAHSSREAHRPALGSEAADPPHPIHTLEAKNNQGVLLFISISMAQDTIWISQGDTSQAGPKVHLPSESSFCEVDNEH